jgi:glycosyltransferase involved in cell wall biosynthesis
MTVSIERELARTALAARLRAVAAVLLAEPPNLDADPAADAATVLLALAESAVERPSNSRIWLLLSGISAAYPTRDDVDEVRRHIELSDAERTAQYLLDFGLSRVRSSGAALASVDVVTHGVLVDVDFTARHDLHTGVQRVVRQTIPLWNRTGRITAVAWTRARGALRPLDPVESTRIYHWPAVERSAGKSIGSRNERTTDEVVLLPWRSILVLPEVPAADVTPRVAAIGACSNNRIVAIGHDTIPLVSADTVSMDESRRFMSYLSALKFASRIAGVSETSTQEFESYGMMLASQGLPPPVTTSVPLPLDFGSNDQTGSLPTRDVPDVVVVGSHDVRKNHLAVLHAAELLWQDGMSFSLTFLGSGGSNTEFYQRVKTLQARGRQVRLRLAVTDAELQAAVSSAAFTVFPSLHEGFGLPVAESLAMGTPVITSNFGATAEIAAGGGAVVVDPRDDHAIADAMRSLLTNDAKLQRLRSEIVGRPKRTWDTYAEELWQAIVDPVFVDLLTAHFDESN